MGRLFSTEQVCMDQIGGGLMTTSPNPGRYPFVKEESRSQAICSVWSYKGKSQAVWGEEIPKIHWGSTLAQHFPNE